MDNLSNLYLTGEYSDCMFISANGVEHLAHRVILSRYAHLKRLVDLAKVPERHVHLPESTQVVERMLQWIYGVDWVQGAIHAGAELMDVMGLCDAAKKYEIPELADKAYAMLGRNVGLISSVKDGLRMVRDLSNSASTAAMLQRRVVDRTLELLSSQQKSGASWMGAEKKRKREADTAASPMADAYPQVIKIPERPPQGVQKKPLETLHCVCKKPSDPYLVQCERCTLWFHPGCVGKGKGALGSYKDAKSALEADEKMYRQQGTVFTCLECDGVAST